MRKKRITAILTVCLLATIGLTGCGDDKPYSQYDLSEYVKVGQYKGLEMEAIQVSVADEEVEAQVKKNVEDTKTSKTVKEGKVEDGDIANIDYEGKIDGKAFEGGTSEGYDLTIGSGSFIPGFEDGLIGKEIGSTVDLNLTFPKDYDKGQEGGEKLGGKDVVFTVTINSVKKETIPPYDDAWVAENSKVKTVDEYNEYVRQQLYDEKEETAKNNKISELWGEVIENSEVLKYPEEEVNGYVEEIEAQYEAMAESSGMELKDLWEQYGIDSEEEYNKQNKEAAEAYVKEQMVMYWIADKEGLSYSEDEAKKLKEDIDEAGYTDETFKQNFGQEIDDYIVAALTFQEVGEFIFDNAKIVEKKATKDEAEASSDEASKDSEASEPNPDADMSQNKDDGADDATSNDEEGGADA